MAHASRHVRRMRSSSPSAAASSAPSGPTLPRRSGAGLVSAVVLLMATIGCVSAEPATVEGPAPSTSPDTRAAAPPGGCAGRGEPTTVTEVYRDDVGGVDPDLVSLDLSIPDVADGCGPVPLVVYVHGGGFSVGDKGNKITDKRRLFTSEGWAFASVNYRLSPSPPNGDPGRVQHPTHVQDVAAAVGWLADEGPARGIDPTRIALMGHSAGAFLVALAATDLSYLGAAGVDPSQVRCAIPLDTRYDPRTEAALSPSAAAMYRNALGDDPARWDAASPLRVVRAKAGTPDFLIVTRGRAPASPRARSSPTPSAGCAGARGRGPRRQPPRPRGRERRGRQARRGEGDPGRHGLPPRLPGPGAAPPQGLT